MNILAFDIETIPDVATGRKLYGLDGLSDKETGQAMFAKRREQTGESEFLRHHMHRVVAISVAMRTRDGLQRAPSSRATRHSAIAAIPSRCSQPSPITRNCGCCAGPRISRTCS